MATLSVLLAKKMVKLTSNGCYLQRCAHRSDTRNAFHQLHRWIRTETLHVALRFEEVLIALCSETLSIAFRSEALLIALRSERLSIALSTAVDCILALSHLCLSRNLSLSQNP